MHVRRHLHHHIGTRVVRSGCWLISSLQHSFRCVSDNPEGSRVRFRLGPGLSFWVVNCISIYLYIGSWPRVGGRTSRVYVITIRGCCAHLPWFICVGIIRGWCLHLPWFIYVNVGGGLVSSSPPAYVELIRGWVVISPDIYIYVCVDRYRGLGVHLPRYMCVDRNQGLGVHLPWLTYVNIKGAGALISPGAYRYWSRGGALTSLGFCEY